MNDLDGALKEFLLESADNLDQLDRDLVALEKNPQDRKRLEGVFRTIHTIKGTCGFFEFARLGALTHAGEGLLSLLRDGKLPLTPPVANVLLRLVDAVRDILAHIERTGTEGDADHAELIATLNALQSGQPPSPASNGLASPDDAEVPVGALTEGNIRVDVDLLERLMNLVGELVLARNQILQFSSSRSDPGFLQASQRLNLITSALQEGVMKTRMQPIGTLWNRLPRVVRDLGRACGKEVRVRLEGQDTELDRTLLEAVRDPLTHLIRNAVDHGLESPEERRRKGKPPAGLLSLRAFHEGGQVNIEVSDDGRGLDLPAIRHKALERGLISAEQAARLGDREVMRLVFLPGFSTAEQVTGLSGRGVGMDVVKSNIEKACGAVDLQTRAGQGTTVKIKIPLTLAIIPALIVTCGPERYAIPQASLLELVRLEPEQARAQVETLYGAPVYRLRGNLLPLVRLAELLRVEPPGPDKAVYIVVLQADDRPFGLVVEDIHDTEEIVVKPLGKYLQGIPLFAGATILGDGLVALILDVTGIAQVSGVLAEARERARAEEPEAPAGPPKEQKHTLLLFEVGPGGRMALPVDQVARLEEFPPQAVERASGQEVVQYRGQILPLLRLARLLPGRRGAEEDGRAPLQVVVCSQKSRTVGLVVDRILDIVESSLEVQPASAGPGILGTAVIGQRVTDLLDVAGLVALHGSSEATGPQEAVP